MSAYYNEFDRYPAAWLRNLSERNLIAPGVVDERSIKDVAAADVRGATQAHWFAGVGVWSYALRLAGWPDDGPVVWTGSCPCQGFSQAGRRRGFDDERHLWPEWFRLIKEHRPAVILGEQVASPDGLIWLDLVSADLEGAGYTVWASDLCAAGVGAPHIRQRLYFVAYSEKFRWPEGWNGRPRDQRDAAWLEFERHGDARELADAYRERFQGQRLLVRERGSQQNLPEAPRSGEVDGLVDAAGLGRGQDRLHAAEGGGASSDGPAVEHCDASAAHGVADAVRAGRSERGPESGGGPPAGGSESEFVADTDGCRRGAFLEYVRARQPDDGGRGEARGLGDTGSARSRRHAGAVPGAQGGPDAGGGDESLDAGEARELGDAGRAGLPEQLGERGILPGAGERPTGQAAQRAGPPTRGFWSDAYWLYCRDGKWRPVESRAQQVAPGAPEGMGYVPPLAVGVEGRVGQIKAYGNGLTSLVAATFIRAFIEATSHLCE